MKYLSQSSFRCGTSDKTQADFSVIFAKSPFDRRAVICQSKGNGGISSELYRKSWLPLMVSAFVISCAENKVSGFSHY